MADVNEAVQFVLRQEDSRLSGDITTIPGDRGGRTRYGLAERWHPELVKQGYFDKTIMPNDEALAIAETVYEGEYGAKLALDQIASQEIGNRLLSFAVNEGPNEAIAIAQRACGFAGCPVPVDGIMGANTLAALNQADPAKWIIANRQLQEGFYRHLVATQPSLLPVLSGLLNRADA